MPAPSRDVLPAKEVRARATRLAEIAESLLADAAKREGKGRPAPAPSARADVQGRLDAVRETLAAEPFLAGPSDRAAGALEQALRDRLGWQPKSVWREYAESIGVALLIALVIRAFFVEAFKIPTGSMIPTLEINDHIFVAKASYGVRIPLLGKYAFTWSEPRPGDVVVFEYPGEGSEKGKDYIKRVVAVPGDRVRYEDYVLHIGGAPVPTSVVSEDVSCNEQVGAIRERGLFSGCGVAYSPREDQQCRCVVSEEQLGDRTYRTQRHRSPHCRTLSGWPLERVPFVSVNEPLFGAQPGNPHWPEVVIPDGHVMVMGDNRDNSRDSRFWGLVPMDAIKGRAFVIWWATEKGRIFDLVH